MGCRVDDVTGSHVWRIASFEGGVKAILNFAPVRLVLPEQMAVKNVNLALELEALSYTLRNR